MPAVLYSKTVTCQKQGWTAEHCTESGVRGSATLSLTSKDHPTPTRCHYKWDNLKKTNLFQTPHKHQLGLCLTIIRAVKTGYAFRTCKLATRHNFDTPPTFTARPWPSHDALDVHVATSFLRRTSFPVNNVLRPQLWVVIKTIRKSYLDSRRQIQTEGCGLSEQSICKVAI
jgi:hypothetical protein